MNLSLPDMVIIALAVWRLSFMLVREYGPFSVFARLRAHTTLGGVLSCVACMSVWAAALMVVLWLTPARPVVYVLAVSGLGLMLASWSGVEFER